MKTYTRQNIDPKRINILTRQILAEGEQFKLTQAETTVHARLTPEGVMAIMELNGFKPCGSMPALSRKNLYTIRRRQGGVEILRVCRHPVFG